MGDGIDGLDSTDIAFHSGIMYHLFALVSIYQGVYLYMYLKVVNIGVSATWSIIIVLTLVIKDRVQVRASLPELEFSTASNRIMSFGRPPSINVGFKTSPPDRGSFPLDHYGP